MSRQARKLSSKDMQRNITKTAPSPMCPMCHMDINAVLEDEYDFTEIQSFMDDSGGWSKQASKGTIANDLAVISQKTGAINPYHVTVDFWTTR